jgi:hypothetical protein
VASNQSLPRQAGSNGMAAHFHGHNRRKAHEQQPSHQPNGLFFANFPMFTSIVMQSWCFQTVSRLMRMMF